MKLDSMGEFWLKESLGSLSVLVSLMKGSGIESLLPKWTENAYDMPLEEGTITYIDELLNDGQLWGRVPGPKKGPYNYKETAEEWREYVKQNLDFARMHLFDPVAREKAEEERKGRKLPPSRCPKCDAELGLVKFNNAQIDWKCTACDYRSPAICWL